MNVSIIIPFFNAVSSLPDLIRSLKEQSLSADLFEVLFIDNRSGDNGASLIEGELSGAGLRYRCLSFEDFPSSYAARNVGVRASSAELLVFTDADCRPHKEWLSTIVSRFKNSNKQNLILSGRVDLQIRDRTNVWELFDHYYHMDNKKAGATSRIATANMAVRRNYFQSVGYFEEVSSGADHLWSERASRKGAEIQYEPEMLVYHPTRKTRNEILKKLRRTSFGLGEISSSGFGSFLKGMSKTLLRPFLFHRHLNFARSIGSAPVTFRAQLFLLSFRLRFYQIIPYFKGFYEKWHENRRT